MPSSTKISRPSSSSAKIAKPTFSSMGRFSIGRFGSARFGHTDPWQQGKTARPSLTATKVARPA